MLKTLKISFALKNTYRVNSILYSLKQIPLLKRALPEALYRVRGFKLLANVLSVLWEIFSTFIGKFIYLLCIIGGASLLYQGLPKAQAMLHMLFFLTLAGCLTNTKMFNPSKDKYYAMILMRMDARAYTLVNHLYAMLKVVIGFLPFTLLFGLKSGLPLWFCCVLPFGIGGMKLFATALRLWHYEKTGKVYMESNLSKYDLLALAVFLAAAFLLPAFHLALPVGAAMMLFLLCVPLGIVGLIKVVCFRDYQVVNKTLLHGLSDLIDASARAKIVKQANENRISADTTITSNRHGFEYLNELFIKRHRKILWQSTKKISFVCLALIALALLAMQMQPVLKPVLNEMILSWLPYFVFIMYAINRGTSFTQALFMNCDHSLLTYAFYKEPHHILRLFRIRLREIMKINAVPALIIGCGLAMILYASGGTGELGNYVVLIVSILCMSLFFSIHYLMIYYLLQPYNAGTEMKSGTYRLVVSLTYLVCVGLMQLRMSILLFGMLTIVFCVLYSIVASILVYRLAPTTFRIRN